ncbi:MAG: ABC transporter substrate-binding protein [Anaerolineales bacterium]|nr:ABC transporter substrate-binding protein [Anaerolineales bacterium]
MNDKKISFALVLALLILTGLAACVPASAPAPAPVAEAKGKIALYTSVPQPIADKIQADFQAKFPGVTLDIFRGGTSEVVAKIMTEKAGGEIIADLVWVAEPSTYEDFKAQDLLLKYTPTEASMLTDEMKDKDGYYYAGRLINMVVAYNSTTEPKPKSWKDLLNPAYKGKVGFPSPLNSGAAEGAVKTLADHPSFGWKYFDDLKANGAKQVANNSTLRDQIASGEFKVGVLLDYMVREVKPKGATIEYIWPDEGAVFIPSPIAIFKTTKNPGAAKAFLDFIISKSGQETMVKLGYFIPIRADVMPPEGAPSLDKIKRLPTDWKAVTRDRQATKDKWTNTFGK